MILLSSADLFQNSTLTKNNIQQAHNLKTMTSHRRRYDVVFTSVRRFSTSCACWDDHQSKNGLDLDQDRRSVGPDLSPNILQRLSADDKVV